MDVLVSSRRDILQRLYRFLMSQMIHLLSDNGPLGTSTNSVLLRNELPPGMLLVDVVLRSNLFPLQHSVQRR
ncbi:hypothetical protein AAG906_037930 [Vitis piasezkii]